ncbi:MAG: glycosyltransferase [Lachnospiraceae bacterium]
MNKEINRKDQVLPVVSVLLSTYNRARTLSESIDSILEQTYTDFELIIVDDGSTDETRDILESYHDTRIRILYLKENHFYCYAANQGLQLVRGRYVAIQNSDDIWDENKLQIQIDFMENNKKYGACFTQITLIDQNGENIDAQYAELAGLYATSYQTRAEWMNFFFFYGNCLCHPSAVIRTSIFKKVGAHNLSYCQLADFDLWIRIVAVSEIYVFPQKLMKYRWGKADDKQASSPTKAHTIRSFNEYMMIRRSLLERLSTEDFIEFFQKEFKNPDSHTELELECEKAFLLMRANAYIPELKVLGIEKMEEVLREPLAVEVLRDKFGFTLHDLYQMNQEYSYYDITLRDELGAYKCQIERLNNVTKQLEQREQQLEEYNQELYQLLQTYQNSTSWKCTKPLRQLCGRVKNCIHKHI